MKIPNFKKSESMGRSAARLAGSKRWLAAIVFLVLILALTACGGKDKPKDPQPDEPPAPVKTPELADASAGLQPPPYEYGPYAPSVVMPDERTLPAATVEEMNTDTESIFVSLVMADEQKLVSLEESFDGYPFEALEFKGLLNDRTSLSFVREGERFLNEDYDMPYFYIIWRNAELRDPATGEEGLYKYVIGIETYYGNTDEFLAEPTTTRKLWKSEKKVVEGRFEELAMGDYYYIIMKDNDGLLYSFFISSDMEDVWALENTEKGTPITVTYYELEMYVWENGGRLLDRQATAYEVN